MKQYRLLSVLSLLLFVVALPNVNAAEDELPIQIELYPQALEKPALKYKLLPSRVEQIAGNAAVYYGKVKAEQNNFFNNRELRENIYRWQSTPLEELLAEDARVPSSGSIDFFLDRGARCRYCDWQMLIGDVQFYAMLLPEVQECRDFGRILGANARIDIAHQRFERAIHRFQTGYALGRHVAESEFIVSGLVGLAICKSMNTQILEFIQQPGAPNLYWGLTTLPSPLIDMRKAIELEANGLELSYPELANYEGIGLKEDGKSQQIHPELWKIPPSRRSPEEWKQLHHAIVRDVLKMTANGNSNAEQYSEEALEENCQRMYPQVKRYFVDRGMDQKRIEAMSVHQAVLVYMLQTFRDLVDDMAKYYGLPYSQAIAGLSTVEQHYLEFKKTIPRELLVGIHLIPAIKSAKQVETRLERKIAVMRALEALRIHGASHAGKLPEAWSDVTEVPIPLDPVTGKPFEYQLEGDIGTLHSPELRGETLHYEIRMSQP